MPRKTFSIADDPPPEPMAVTAHASWRKRLDEATYYAEVYAHPPKDDATPEQQAVWQRIAALFQQERDLLLTREPKGYRRARSLPDRP